MADIAKIRHWLNSESPLMHAPPLSEIRQLIDEYALMDIHIASLQAQLGPSRGSTVKGCVTPTDDHRQALEEAKRQGIGPITQSGDPDLRNYVATHAAVGLRIAQWDMPTPRVVQLAYELADAIVEESKK